MRRLLYPLIASALITIVPFLLTFEKGQDIARGLFGFEYFALLLLLVFLKDKMPTSLRVANATKQSMHKSLVIVVLFIVIVCALFAVAWIDLQNQLAIKNWSTSWYGLVPFATCGLSIAMVWKIKPYKFNTIFL